MKTRMFFLLGLVLAFLEENSLWTSEKLEDNLDKALTAKQASYLKHHEVSDRLSQGMLRDKKLRIQLALAPATQEYLTEEFITIVQNLSYKMDVYKKCYVIRAAMKLPAEHIATLKGFIVNHLEQLQLVPSSARVSFIKKLREKDLTQWQDEILKMIKQHQK